MSEYVSRCRLEVNGETIEDFKSVTEGERELAKQVNLMNETGIMKKTPRPSLTVDYVVPSGPGFDWDGLTDGRVTIEYEDGTRITYTGVRTLKVGEAKADGENEMVQTITLGAAKRIKE